MTIESDIRDFYEGVKILAVWVNKENYKIYDLEFESLDELKKVLRMGTGALHGTQFYFRYSKSLSSPKIFCFLKKDSKSKFFPQK